MFRCAFGRLLNQGYARGVDLEYMHHVSQATRMSPSINRMHMQLAAGNCERFLKKRWTSAGNFYLLESRCIFRACGRYHTCFTGVKLSSYSSVVVKKKWPSIKGYIDNETQRAESSTDFLKGMDCEPLQGARLKRTKVCFVAHLHIVRILSWPMKAVRMGPVVGSGPWNLPSICVTSWTGFLAA